MFCQVTGTGKNYRSIAIDKSDAGDSHSKQAKIFFSKLMRTSGIPATATTPIHTVRRKLCKAFALHLPLVIPAHVTISCAPPFLGERLNTEIKLKLID
jgi:hypothetical protein